MARTSARGAVQLTRELIAKAWQAWADRATYGDVGFWPSRDVQREGVLNTFRGYAYEHHLGDASVVAAAADAPDVAIMDQLMLFVCGGATKKVSFERIIALKLQQPMRPPRLNLVFNGRGGLGKDTLVDWVGYFFLGDPVYASSGDGQNDYFSSFNDLLENKVAAKLEEGEGASFHGAWERFKALVTRDTININAKNEKVRAVASWLLWFVTMNRENSVPVETDDRRTVIFQAQQHAHQRDWAWFDKVYAARARPAVIKHFVQRWLAMDVTAFDYVAERPISRMHQHACAAAVPRVMQFLGEAFDDAPLLPPPDADASAHDGDAPALPSFVSYAALFDQYKSWHATEHGKLPSETKKQFRTNLDVAMRVGGAPLVGPVTTAAMSHHRSAAMRGWKVHPARLRAWLQACGYLAKEDADGGIIARADDACAEDACAENADVACAEDACAA